MFFAHEKNIMGSSAPHHQAVEELGIEKLRVTYKDTKKLTTLVRRMIVIYDNQCPGNVDAGEESRW